MNNNNTTPDFTFDWINVIDSLPERKAEQEYSEECLVWYKGEPNARVEGYGIAYYHYTPPFKEKGTWVDFANYGRQPDFWKPIQPPTKKQIHEPK